jgi:hypothetical protein
MVAHGSRFLGRGDFRGLLKLLPLIAEKPGKYAARLAAINHTPQEPRPCFSLLRRPSFQVSSVGPPGSRKACCSKRRTSKRQFSGSKAAAIAPTSRFSCWSFPKHGSRRPSDVVQLRPKCTLSKMRRALSNLWDGMGGLAIEVERRGHRVPVNVRGELVWM